MGQKAFFHAPHGGADFLGWRRRGDAVEVIYDDGVARHMVWRVAAEGAFENSLSDGLQRAVAQRRILPALHDEMRRRSIGLEVVQS